MINIKLKGVFKCRKGVRGEMMKEGRGRMINVACVVGVCGKAGEGK
ncbi:hypothetical protein [Bacillus altitudinis]|nr:hypothetical protein [Bacillus altitudinis]